MRDSGQASAAAQPCAQHVYERGTWWRALHVQAAEEALEGFGVVEQDMEGLQQRLGAFAGGRLEAAVREAANTALPRMKERFTEASAPASSTGAAGICWGRCGVPPTPPALVGLED